MENFAERRFHQQTKIKTIQVYKEINGTDISSFVKTFLLCMFTCYQYNGISVHLWDAIVVLLVRALQSSVLTLSGNLKRFNSRITVYPFWILKARGKYHIKTPWEVSVVSIRNKTITLSRNKCINHKKFVPGKVP